MKNRKLKFLPEVAGVLALVWSLYYLHNILAGCGGVAGGDIYIEHYRQGAE